MKFRTIHPSLLVLTFDFVRLSGYVIAVDHGLAVGWGEGEPDQPESDLDLDLDLDLSAFLLALTCRKYTHA